MDEKPSFYTVREVLEILRTSRPTLEARIKEGVFRTTKIGRRVLFDKKKFSEDLDRLSKFEHAPIVREKFPPRRSF